METVHSFAPFAAVLAPLVGAALILLTGRKRANLRESWTILAALAQFLSVYSILPPVLRGNEDSPLFGAACDPPPPGRRAPATCP